VRTGRELLEKNCQAERVMETYDPHKNTTETRQGDRKLWNMRPLLIGTIVVALALGLIWLIFAMQAPPPGS
jgi:hypothetical protein